LNPLCGSEDARGNRILPPLRAELPFLSPLSLLPLPLPSTSRARNHAVSSRVFPSLPSPHRPKGGKGKRKPGSREAGKRYAIVGYRDFEINCYARLYIHNARRTAHEKRSDRREHKSPSEKRRAPRRRKIENSTTAISRRSRAEFSSLSWRGRAGGGFHGREIPFRSYSRSSPFKGAIRRCRNPRVKTSIVSCCVLA